MQKLLKRNTYIPTDAPQVCSSMTVSLNKDESLSEHSLKTFDNNSDEDQPQHREGLNVNVYVLNKNGNVLMPCKPAKARHLLEEGKAKVVKRSPFTIQLTWNCEENIQDITLGIDPGYKTIGFSAVTEKKELISGEVKLDNGMSKRLQDRAMYRKLKRNKLWYREPRFSNRGIKKGWLAPSVQRRLDTHIKLVNRIKKLLPITDVILEVANFDIQKIENPEIEGRKYQQGNMLDYKNMRSYIIARENNKCQLCKKSIKGKKINLHHIIPENKGGTDKPDNLALLHESCHKKLHKQNLGHKLKKNKQYKGETFMNIIRQKLKEALNCKITFGYVTHQKILDQGLEKTHINDAFVIAGGNGQIRTKSFQVIQKRKNNRCLQLNRKGFKPSIRRQRYKYRPKDLVKINNKIFEVITIFNCGSWIRLKNSLGVVINKAVKKLDNYIFHQGTLVWKIIQQKQGQNSSMF